MALACKAWLRFDWIEIIRGFLGQAMWSIAKHHKPFLWFYWILNGLCEKFMSNQMLNSLPGELLFGKFLSCEIENMKQLNLLLKLDKYYVFSLNLWKFTVRANWNC